MTAILKILNTLKQCATCKESKPTTCFYINNAAKDKLQASCIDCDKSRQKKRRGVQKFRDYSKQYRKSKFNDMQYRLQNILNASRARAKDKNLENNLTLKDLYSIYPKDGLCPVFGFKLEWNSKGYRESSPSLDRIDASKGYTIDNVQIISWKANRLKSDASIEDLDLLLSFLKSGG